MADEGSVRQRRGCPALEKENSVWIFPALRRDSPVIPALWSHFILCEAGVMLLSERFPGKRNLPAWRWCFKGQRSIGRSRLHTQASDPIDAFKCLGKDSWWDMLSQMAQFPCGSGETPFAFPGCCWRVSVGFSFPLSCSGVQGGSPGQSHSPTGALQPQGATPGAERHRRSRWRQHWLHHLW